jgi:hypothetical protein
MRCYIRHPSDIPIEYQTDENGGAVSQEHLNNVSNGGLSFTCSRKLAPGSLLVIRIATVEPQFEARAQVVWCQPEDDAYVTGVAFTESGDLFRMRMVEQLCHIEHYKAEVLANEGRQLDGEQAAREWIDKFAHAFPLLDED